MPQISPITLDGAQGDEPLARLHVPDHATPDGPARNIAHAYLGIADAIRDGKPFDPDFDHAVRLHELLEALQHSTDDGRAVKVR